MTAPIKVIYWNNQPTPYLTARLNAVVAADPAIDLEVWFDGFRESNRSWDVHPEDFHFRWSVLPNGWDVVRRLAATRPDVLVCNYDQRRMLLGAILSRAACRRICLRVLPAYSAQADLTAPKSLAWHLLFRIVDGAKVPGPDGAAFAGRFGLPAQRTWRVTQSIDVDLYGSARRTRPVDVDAAETTAGPAPVRFVTVGRIVASKGIDALLQAWRAARPSLPGCELTMVGDGTDEERAKAAAADLPEVTWAGFAQPKELPAIYAASDVLIFPTLGDPNGLVVEEAMAAGLPVISTDAAGDIRLRVPEGDAGWVVPAGDVAALARAMVHAAQLPVEELRAMGERNAARAAAFGPEEYAADFEVFCRGVLAAPRRRNLLAGLAFALSFTARLTTLGRGTARGGPRLEPRSQGARD